MKTIDSSNSTTYKVSNIPEIVFVAGGTFTMGFNNKERFYPPIVEMLEDMEEEGLELTNDEHEVSLRSYYIGKYPVTFKEYDEFCKESGAKYPGDYDWGRGMRPVIEVSWFDAVKYCKWLRKHTGIKFRLLSEAEWEYAAMGGLKSQGKLYAGSNCIHDVAWYWKNSGNEYANALPEKKVMKYLDENLSFDRKDFMEKEYYSKTQIVGIKTPNELGLFDMSGNVNEWCIDYYAIYSPEKQVNPYGPEEGYGRVLRGGCYTSECYDCQIKDRSFHFPRYGYSHVGFRVAVSAS